MNQNQERIAGKVDWNASDEPTANLYQSMKAADEDFRRELVRVYGERKASKARYKYEHKDPAVQKAAMAFVAASNAWHAAQCQARPLGSPDATILSQDRINEVASRYGFTSNPIEAHSDRSITAILTIDGEDDCYYQVILRTTSSNKVICHVGLYRERCIVNDGEVTLDDLKSAMLYADNRIRRISAYRIDGPSKESEKANAQNHKQNAAAYVIAVKNDVAALWLVGPATANLTGEHPETTTNLAEALRFNHEEAEQAIFDLMHRWPNEKFRIDPIGQKMS